MAYRTKLFSPHLTSHSKNLWYTRVSASVALIIFINFLLPAQKTEKPYHFARKPLIVAEKAALSTAHPEATKIGLAVLKKGGNAYDCAVAVHFALAVCYPTAGNIGGGGFANIRKADGTADILDFRETAPAKASRDMYLDSAGNVIKDKSIYGALPAGVPGSVRGMYDLHKKYGSLPWAELVQPAINLAYKGFPITKMQAEEFNNHKENFDKYSSTPDYLRQYRYSRATDYLTRYILTENRSIKYIPWKEGDTLTIPDLAKTLEAIRDEGFEGFYRGWVADSIVAEMQRSGGIISHQDLTNYTCIWRKPLVGDYRGYKVYTMPPPSAGGIALLQILNVLETMNMKTRGFNTILSVWPMVEAEKLAYADRSKYIGDPDFINIPVDTLLKPQYMRNRFFSLLTVRANPSEGIKPGEFDWKESEETTHYSIVDQYGNAIAVTTTINNPYGSHCFVRGCGFLLNNEMDDFSIKPGVLNSYKIPGSKANSIAPGKRMVSSMSPTIVEKDGKLFMVTGSPGGSTIATTVLQTIVNVIDHGMDVQSAVDAPRFHHQWKPDILYYDDDAFSNKTISYLKSIKYKLEKRSPIGRADAIVVKDGKIYGGADHRGDDKADGF